MTKRAQKPTTTRKKSRNSREQDILEAAISLFAQNGFDGTSLDAIIDASNTSKGTLYHYFSSKEDLYATVLAEMLDEIWSHFDIGALKRGTRESFWTSVALWWKRSAEYMLSNPTHLRLWKDFQENMRSFSDAGPTQRLREQTLSNGVKLVEIGQSLGCVRDDLSPIQCANLIEALDVVMDDWFFSLAAEQGAAEAFAQQAPISLGLVWRVLAPPDELKHFPKNMI